MAPRFADFEQDLLSAYPRENQGGAASYAAFMLQGIPLILFALALRAFDVPLEIKALAVAVGGSLARSVSAGSSSAGRASARSPDETRGLT
jgi:hypothetical protein